MFFNLKPKFSLAFNNRIFFGFVATYFNFILGLFLWHPQAWRQERATLNLPLVIIVIILSYALDGYLKKKEEQLFFLKRKPKIYQWLKQLNKEKFISGIIWMLWPSCLVLVIGLVTPEIPETFRASLAIYTLLSLLGTVIALILTLLNPRKLA